MRYFPQSENEIQDMFSTIGVASWEDLFKSIPRELRLSSDLKIDESLSEQDLGNEFEKISGKNNSLNRFSSFLGGGLYQHFIPAVVDYLSSRGEFLTPYTPYQPEVSQGTLQAVFEFQSMIASLSGLDVANASIYDGASAAAEAVLMASRITRKNKVVIGTWIHPDYLKVIESYTKNQDMEIIILGNRNNPFVSVEELNETFNKYKNEIGCVLIQSPNFAGNIVDVQTLAERSHQEGSLFIQVVTEAMSLGYLRGPGEMGVDIFAGEGQSFGLYMQFGGPSLGLFAAKEKYLRQMPGRIVGQCPVLNPGADKPDQGFVLTLSAREQHIRRDKATSNICTNQGLMALRATIYLSIMGKKGLFAAAKQNHANALYLSKQISSLKGWGMVFPETPFFNEFLLETPEPARKIIAAGREEGIYPGMDISRYIDGKENHLLITTTEIHRQSDLDKLLDFFKKFSH